MPEPKPRNTGASAPQPSPSKPAQGNPRWLVPTMLGLLLIGLLWVVVTYVMRTEYPIPGIGNWNLAIGFALMFAGFALTLRWR